MELKGKQVQEGGEPSSAHQKTGRMTIDDIRAIPKFSNYQPGEPNKVSNISTALAVQKVLSGSDRAGRLRLITKYIGHRLVARPELDSTFWTDSTGTLKSLWQLTHA